MNDVPDYNNNLLRPGIDMANKDVREAWLEGAVKLALADVRLMQQSLEVLTIGPDDPNRVRVGVARERIGTTIRHLEETIRRIDQADAERKAYWERRKREAIEISQRPVGVRLVERKSASLLPTIAPTEGGDDRPLFLQRP